MSTARAVRLIDLVCRRVEAGARRHRPTSDLWPLRAQVVDLHSPESFLLSVDQLVADYRVLIMPRMQFIRSGNRTAMFLHIATA